MTQDHPDRQDLIARLLQLPPGSLAECLADMFLERLGEGSGLPEDRETEGSSGNFGECKSFTQWLEEGMRDYRFPELRRFRVEGERAFLMFHNRDIEIKARMESLPEGQVPVLPRAPVVSGNNGGEPHGSGTHDPQPTPDVERFKNLEL